MNNFQDISVGFLTHLSRSGSTLLARMLDEFDDICVTTEGEFPLELFGVKSYSPITFNTQKDLETYLDNVLGQTRVASWNLPNEAILKACQSLPYPISGPTLIRKILSVYRDIHKPGAQVVIYKACPFMPWHIPASIIHFPDTVFLHLLRDPRAVYHSQLKSIDPFTGKPFSTSALKTAMDWKKAASLTRTYPDLALTEVRFETLVENPDQVLQRIVLALGLENESKGSASSSFSSRMAPADQALHQEITQSPDPQKIKTWEKSLADKDVQIIDTYLAELMEHKGYAVFSSENIASPLTSLKIKAGVQREWFRTLMRRSRRIIQAFVSNPLHLFRKLILKTRHD